LGATWGQRLIWVQTGDPKHTHTESEKRESVTRVSTSLGHLSMPVPRVSTSLVHLIHVGPTCLTSGSHLFHVSAPHWSTSPSPCHMAEHSLTQSDQTETYSSISLVHIISHITISATWQLVNGPHQQLLHQTETHGSTA
jgi:hypothetical protein